MEIPTDVNKTVNTLGSLEFKEVSTAIWDYLTTIFIFGLFDRKRTTSVCFIKEVYIEEPKGYFLKGL